MQKELKTRQIILFFIAFIPLSKLFMMPSVLAKHAGEDMWLSALFNILLDFITLFFIVFAMQNANENIFLTLEKKLGKVGAKIVFFLFFVYFTVKAIIPLNEQKDYVELTLYTLMPTMLYFIPFFLVAFYFCTKRLRVIGRASDVLWITTLLGIIIIFSLSLSNADFLSLLPVGARGVSATIKGTFSALTWFSDSAYCLFFVGEFNCKDKDKKKILFAQLLSGLIVILFLIIFYSVFTSIAYRQRFALTEISKYTSVINNVGRFDYLGILLLLFGNLFTMSLPIFFSSKILNYLFGLKKAWISPIISVGIQLFIMTVFHRHLSSIENFITGYGGVLFLIVGNILPIIISLSVKKEKNYELTQS
jgi:hypothetical protein